MDRLFLKYEKLLSIHFTHPEYSFSGEKGGVLSNSMRIQPDGPTQLLFKKHDIHYRFRKDMLLIFVRIREDQDAPYFRLPNIFSARFLFDLNKELINQTPIPDNHGGENIFRIRINLRSSASEMDLSGATLGPLESREPKRVFHPLVPPHWEIIPVNLKGSFGVIDMVTEGSSTHRLYTDVANQILNYTTANGNEHEHLFTIHLNP
jgi:hypothetical protein